jgi:hypothetical protein
MPYGAKETPATIVTEIPLSNSTTIMSCDCDVDLHSLMAFTKGHCDSGMIFGKDGSMMCSKDHDYALYLTADEAKRLGREVTNQDFAAMREGGIQVNGVVYLPEEGPVSDVVMGHKDDEYVYIQATICAVVIAHATSSDTPNHEAISKAVSKVAGDLRNLGL